MTIEINDDTAEEITLEYLKELHNSSLAILSNTLSNTEFEACYSFDYDEEVFALVDEIRSLELVMSILGYGSGKLNKLLHESNNQIYITDKTYQELKLEYQFEIQKNHILNEELDILKSKIKILGDFIK